MDKTQLRGLNTTIEVDFCENCKGTWFDNGELSRVDTIIEPVVYEFRKIDPFTTQMEALYCPSCNEKVLMSKAEHPRDNKVIHDYCPSCKGIWLDKGELEAIQKENWLTTVVKVFRWLQGKEN